MSATLRSREHSLRERLLATYWRNTTEKPRVPAVEPLLQLRGMSLARGDIRRRWTVGVLPQDPKVVGWLRRRLRCWYSRELLQAWYR